MKSVVCLILCVGGDSIEGFVGTTCCTDFPTSKGSTWQTTDGDLLTIKERLYSGPAAGSYSLDFSV